MSGAGSANGEVPIGHGSGRAAVIYSYVRELRHGGRTPETRLEEAVGLAGAIDLEVVHAEAVHLSAPRPATLLGQGKVEEYKALIAGLGVEVLVVDGALTPVQQRNLERALDCKVIDRTGLILEIFGARARTREGRLQVELARQTFQRSRLVRSWTHLERQRGGLGAVGGPGETQIEADRRAIDERIIKIRRQLAEVTRTRELHRKRRRQAPWPVVALVGYTNAGKSTTFNRIASAGVLAADQLFATLDPTMRGVDLPSGRRIILSDTVGFISDLPTHLVAAFRATLEEVLEATLVVHVRDITHAETEAQRTDVELVLADLGVQVGEGSALVEAWNKADLLPPDARAALEEQARRRDDVALLSAATGEGLDGLLALIDRRLAGARRIVDFAVPLSDGATLAWVYRHGDVLTRDDSDEMAHFRVGFDAADVERLRRRLPDAGLPQA